MPAILPMVYFDIPASTSCASNAGDDERSTSKHDIRVDLHTLEPAVSQAITFKQHLFGRVEELTQQLRGYTSSSITDDVVRNMTLDLIKSGVRAVLQDQDDDEIFILTSKDEFETMIEDEDDEDDEDVKPPTPCAFARSSIPSLDAIFDSKGVVIATWELPEKTVKAVTLQSFHPDRLTDSLIQIVVAPLYAPSE